MARTLVQDLSGTSRPDQSSANSDVHHEHRARRRLGTPIVLQIAAMVGIGALLYSSAADWFASINHNSEISGYVRLVEQLPDETRLEKLQLARDYNTHMPAGTLRDPYAAGADNSDLAEDAAYQSYLEVLRVSDDGVIGEVSYPRLGISLPIYHGTGEAAISKGVGHFYGSSLPVGGSSSHSVLTSHSGLVNASLFTPLPKARIGDTFQVTVLGETHHYEVDGIETVEPFVTDSLGITPNEDRVTLITCTPIGVNSHRLLVHATRVSAPDADSGGAIAGDGKVTGFPWWAVGFLGGSGLIAYLLFAPPRRSASRHSSPTRDIDPNSNTDINQERNA